mgnify:CR=1 FL=1
MEHVIELSHVTKDFGGNRGVFDIDFCVQKGEVFGYLGPNGAGKSTTIRQLMGFIRPQRGECKILGMDCFKETDKVQRHVGYLAGEIAFMDDMSGLEYIEFIAKMKGIQDMYRMNELIERFELNPKSKIRKMSKGMKQKIGLVTAFMGNPQVLILDEPTSGLDPLMQNRFVELVLEEKKRGTTILMSSHIFDEVERTCDRTAIIRQGRIVDTVSMETLSNIKSKVYVVTLKDERCALRMAKESGLHIKEVKSNKVKIRVKDDLPDVLRTIAGYEPEGLEMESQTLEELFMHYYGEDGVKNV